MPRLPRPRGSVPSCDFRTNDPQKNTAVANSTSHGTSPAKKVGGVTSRSSAPKIPPARLMMTSAFSESRSAPVATRAPAYPVATCPGNSAIVEVMLAALGSRPARTSIPSVTNDPPPASAFWAPAQMPAAMSRIQDVMMPTSARKALRTDGRNAASRHARVD